MFQKSRRLLATCSFAVLALSASPALAQWTNGQAATVVIGQVDFDNANANVGATALDEPTGVAVDVARNKLYVADSKNNRVVRYAYPVVSNTPTAEIAFGQADLNSGSSNNGGLSAATMSSPIAVAVDNSGTLFVADRDNNRVLVFEDAHLTTASGSNANRVLGQPDFVSQSAGNLATQMDMPTGIAFEAPNRLWVSESINSRVIRFDNVSSKATGAAADGVLGQISFGVSGPAGSAVINKFKDPQGIAVISGTLYVCDPEFNRVLRFNAAAGKANGANADGVLGQTLFTDQTDGDTSSGLKMPYGLGADNSGRLYIVERDNNRTMLHNSVLSKGNGAPADNVLGQALLGGATSSATSNVAHNAPQAAAADSVNNRLLVADTLNHRVIVFQASSALPVSMSTFTLE